MSEADAQAKVGRVEFTGSRHELLDIVVRGYALMIPTIGLYRFWQATWKRRFYWQNTIIDGEPLEYTGSATQLLTGFFYALIFFVPIYAGLFFLSMQDTDLLLVGYIAVGAVVWFLTGYAIYRARDFRLSRTLWRGIRFDLKGHALAYALRRFLWSILMVATLGLVYPFMASSLWRYRYTNTWYGDRKFEISGNWRAFAAPYYVTYFLNGVAIGATAIWIVAAHDFTLVGTVPVPGPLGWLMVLGCAFLLALTLAWYRARTMSRMLSTVRVGAAALTLQIRTGSLFGQFVVYLGLVAGLLVVLALVALLALGGIYEAASAGGRTPDAAALMEVFQSGSLNVLLLIGVYLVIFGALGLLGELVLSFGWWRLLAKGTTITNPESLYSVRAAVEDPALIGEGLADALNVGTF